MKINLFLLLVIFGTHYSCQNGISPEGRSSPEELYEAACTMMEEMQYDSALSLLEQSFQQGFDNPMRLVGDPRLATLIDDPELRPEIRRVLKENASVHSATMVAEKEPGFPITVSGKILDESTGEALGNVLVELVQTDSLGKYFTVQSMFNPRLFA